MWAAAGATALGLGALLAGEGDALAAGSAHCMARILRDVAAIEAPEQIKSKSNGEFGPVTQIRVYKDTGKMVFCAKNSYCYDSNAFEFITACRIKRDIDRAGETYFAFFTR